MNVSMTYPQCPSCGYEGPHELFEEVTFDGGPVVARPAFICGNHACARLFTAGDSPNNVVVG